MIVQYEKVSWGILGYGEKCINLRVCFFKVFKNLKVTSKNLSWFSQFHTTYEHFYLALPFLVEAMEIINCTHAKWDILKRSKLKVGIIKQNRKQRRC